ncbi:hypothetical protein [Chitinilyticum piscinae]|uniref:Uncharacterized protein n=1 Tax=Chitinilyticum piscinae TaxID=2866724 RepID=A0A8J7FPU5_9NEIS|nr:hypothetical protein [Chitinilyticum piscinae]MBE9608406.1 hypothetical protein [Chitinilyticum piscinae]
MRVLAAYLLLIAAPLLAASPDEPAAAVAPASDRAFVMALAMVLPSQLLACSVYPEFKSEVARHWQIEPKVAPPQDERGDWLTRCYTRQPPLTQSQCRDLLEMLPADAMHTLTAEQRSGYLLFTKATLSQIKAAPRNCQQLEPAP